MYTLDECEAVWGESEIEDNEHVCVGMGGQGSCNVSLSCGKVMFSQVSVSHSVHRRGCGYLRSHVLSGGLGMSGGGYVQGSGYHAPSPKKGTTGYGR